MIRFLPIVATVTASATAAATAFASPAAMSFTTTLTIGDASATFGQAGSPSATAPPPRPPMRAEEWPLLWLSFVFLGVVADATSTSGACRLPPIVSSVRTVVDGFAASTLPPDPTDDDDGLEEGDAGAAAPGGDDGVGLLLLVR